VVIVGVDGEVLRNRFMKRYWRIEGEGGGRGRRKGGKGKGGGGYGKSFDEELCS
jgi:hypothetical protein